MTVSAISLCFNHPTMIRASLGQFYATKSKELPVRHILVDQHYPLPDKRANRIELRKIAEEFGCELIDAGKNIGLQHGLNLAFAHIKPEDSDFVIGFDPDCYPISPGWDMALITALAFDPKAVWASLWNLGSSTDLVKSQYIERRTQHLRVWELTRPCMNSVCAWKAGWIKKVGGFREPNELYGGLECSMWVKFTHHNEKWVFLPDWHEARMPEEKAMGDEDYKIWKWRWAHEGSIKVDFESWLRQEGKIQ